MSRKTLIKNSPRSELDKRLNGDDRYNHMLICSGNHFKPIGTPGCICLYALLRPVDMSKSVQHNVYN